MAVHQVAIYKTIHTEVVQSLSEKLQAFYVFSNVANEISMLLQKRLSEGAYRHIINGERLAVALTENIQEVNQDKTSACLVVSRIATSFRRIHGHEYRMARGISSSDLVRQLWAL